MKIINPWWNNGRNGPEFYNLTDKVFELGDFAIYRYTSRCHYHTYKNIAIACLVKANRDLIRELAKSVNPKYQFIRNKNYYDDNFRVERSRSIMKRYDAGEWNKKDCRF